MTAGASRSALWGCGKPLKASCVLIRCLLMTISSGWLCRTALQCNNTSSCTEHRFRGSQHLPVAESCHSTCHSDRHCSQVSHRHCVVRSHTDILWEINSFYLVNLVISVICWEIYLVVISVCPVAMFACGIDWPIIWHMENNWTYRIDMLVHGIFSCILNTLPNMENLFACRVVQYIWNSLSHME